MTDINDIPLALADGFDTTLGTLAPGKLVLLVNTASECGLTPQYEGLQGLQDAYRDRGFTVVGVPCNQFGGQEPGTAEEISELACGTYGVDFPLLAKTEVNGPDAHALYGVLRDSPSEDGEAGDIQWNFEKFLISPSGEVLGRFRPRTEPGDPAVVALIEQNLPS